MKEKILLVVDLQKEFADNEGMYPKILKFVKQAIDGTEYNRVIATKCGNFDGSNFVRYTNWVDLIDGADELEFTPDKVIEKVSYGLTDYKEIPKNAMIHVVGYNTGACVLKVALDLFDLDYDFRVLSDYCYSGDGYENHVHGLWTLNHLLGKAVI